MEQPAMEIEINVRIHQTRPMYGSIQLNETIKFPEADFMGIAAIMKRFHDLAEELKKQSR